jgi:hypothetical protein
MSSLLDSPPTEKSAKENRHRDDVRRHSAGPMVRILFPPPNAPCPDGRHR